MFNTVVFTYHGTRHHITGPSRVKCLIEMKCLGSSRHSSPLPLSTSLQAKKDTKKKRFELMVLELFLTTYWSKCEL